MGFLKAKLLAGALYQLLKYTFTLFTPEDVRIWIDDKILDPIEDKYADNKTVILLVNNVRAISSIPDDIGGDLD